MMKPFFTFFTKANVSNLCISSDEDVFDLGVTEHKEEVDVDVYSGLSYITIIIKMIKKVT